MRYNLLILFVAVLTWHSSSSSPQQPTAVEIVSQAQQQLAVRLKAAIDSGGTVKALDVCSVEALMLTQHVADDYGVSLRRVSLRPRNPYNTPDTLEMRVLEQMQSQDATEGKSDTIVIVHNGRRSTFYPIRIAEKPCMACHGSVNGTITAETYAAIREKYPDDKATGYQPGELRGAWVITTK